MKPLIQMLQNIALDLWENITDRWHEFCSNQCCRIESRIYLRFLKYEEIRRARMREIFKRFESRIEEDKIEKEEKRTHDEKMDNSSL